MPIDDDAILTDRLRLICERPHADALFQPITWPNDVIQVDPYDVESLQAEARAALTRELDRCTDPDSRHGRILLLLGAAGAGKTHLARAFRTRIHGTGAGLFAYIDLSPEMGDLGDRVLERIVTALDYPYFPPDRPDSQLMRLARALAERSGDARSEALLGEEYAPEQLWGLVADLADRILARRDAQHLDLYLVRVLLVLAGGGPALRPLALRWLRGAARLAPIDRERLPVVADAGGSQAATAMIRSLAQALAVGHRDQALVLFLDQFENLLRAPDAKLAAQQWAAFVVELTGMVPNLLVVLSCTIDHWASADGVSAHISKSHLDRIEQDPPVVQLRPEYSLQDFREILVARLRFLDDSDDRPPSIAPFSEDFVAAWHATHNVRRLLEAAQGFVRLTKALGRLPTTAELVSERLLPSAPPGGATGSAERGGVSRYPRTDRDSAPAGGGRVTPEERLGQQWRAWLAAHPALPKELHAPERLLSLLADSLPILHRELDRPGLLRGERVHECLRLAGPPGVPIAYLGVCDKGPQGGALGRELTRLMELAEGGEPRALRIGDFPSPKSRGAQLNRTYAELNRRGGQRIGLVVDELRQAWAMGAFLDQGPSGDVDAWLRQERPLGSLNGLRQAFGLDAALRAAPEVDRQAQPQPRPETGGEAKGGEATEPDTGAKTLARGNLALGVETSRSERQVSLPVSTLLRHSVILGASGSGKTTLALLTIEQLLEQGTPVIMLDRKGDLASYADPRAEARAGDGYRQWRGRVQVDLYTPGHPEGRDLAIPVVPAPEADIGTHELDRISLQAAEVLCAYLHVSRSKQATYTSLLARAFRILAREEPGRGPGTLTDVIELLVDHDPDLLGGFVTPIPPKDCDDLARKLDEQRVLHAALLNGSGESLDVARLFAPEGERARLSIVSTRFLSDEDARFWVSQFLIALGRHVSRAPAERLQGLLTIDEADIYMPAVGKPATKQPLIDLLKRARSGGLGVMLVSQNPGDFDYSGRNNITTWLIGKVTQDRALEKLREIIEAGHANGRDIARQTQGEFHLLSEPRQARLRAPRNLLETRQMSPEQILEAAAFARGGSRPPT